MGYDAVSQSLKRAVVPYLPCCVFIAGVTAYAQFGEIGPPPVSASVARQQVRTLLGEVDSGNRQETIKRLSDLARWYREILDEELIVSWRRGATRNLTEVVEQLADPRVAAGIVEFSWREQRQATFNLLYAPLLGHLMERYPDSAKPFLYDLLNSDVAPGHALDLWTHEAEAVCRILLDMPNVRDWRQDALRILPHYRDETERLLDQDLHGVDREKAYRATRWLAELAAVDPAFNAHRSAAIPGPSAGTLSDGAHRVILKSLDPVTVDDTFVSKNIGRGALIEFQNRSGRPVDVYWISQQGKRVRYAQLATGATYLQSTWMGHPWLVVVSDTGGTTARDTGIRLAGFEPVTPNDAFDPAKRDIAIIASQDAASASPKSGSEPASQNPGSAPDTSRSMAWPGVYHMGNGVTAPVVISKAEPEYSPAGRKLRAEGTVALQLAVQPGGSATNFRIVRSLGYGLDEKAIDAVSRWRFQPGMKDGKAVPVAATVEVHFRMLRTSEANIWYSGPTAFRLSAGITLPVAEDGSMPRPGKEVADESAVLEFTVNTNGSVRNVHSIYGSASASELLGRYLSGWKFRPAVDRGGFIEATGRIQFIKGKGDEAVNRPLFDFPTPAPTISVSDTGSPAPQIDQIDTAGPRGSEHPASLVNPKDGLRYVWIPPGVFTMGCSQGDTECVDNEKPPHEEQIVSGFWLGQTEVTQAAYQRVTGSNPSAHKGDQLPVESVTWNDAASYCGAIGGHLPSEVEWEYAARGGVPWARYGDLDAVAWHSGNSGGTAHPVGLKQRNAFGLFDMLGNVWEWVLDSYPDSSGSDKILRGGSWRLAPTNARVSRRFVVKPSDSADGRGFRCVVSSAPPNEDNLPGGLGEQVYHVGNGVSAPELIHHISVEYSEAARNQKISGVVILDIIIDARGTVVDPKVITGLGFGLDDKAIEAVRQWKFRPGYKDGKPVAVAMRVQVAFRLE